MPRNAERRPAPQSGGAVLVRPDGAGWLAEYTGERGPTQAWGSCPWEAAAKCCWYMRNRWSRK